MVQYYDSTIRIRGQDLSAAVEQVLQDMKNAGASPPPVRTVTALAEGAAEMTYAENFTNAIAALRASL